MKKFVCMAMAACGGSKYEVYKDKMLEAMASDLGTTKELLIKDLDLKFDSMSISNFLVEDSINMLTKQREAFEAEITKRLEKTKAKIEEYDEKSKTAKGVSIFVNRSLRDDNKRELKRLESVRKDVYEKFEKAMGTLKPRDKKEVIYQVFHFTLTALNPRTKVHEVKTDVVFFTPDGQNFLKDVSDDVAKYAKGN